MKLTKRKRPLLQVTILLLDDGELLELAKGIRAVVRFDDQMAPIPCDQTFSEGKLYYVEEPGVHNVAFTLRPKPIRQAVGLRELDRVTMHFRYRDARILSATVGQVLAQIPEKLIDQAVAFELFPLGMISKDNGDGSGYHFAEAVVYGIDPDFHPSDGEKDLFPFGKHLDGRCRGCSECESIALFKRE